MLDNPGASTKPVGELPFILRVFFFTRLAVPSEHRIVAPLPRLNSNTKRRGSSGSFAVLDACHGLLLNSLISRLP